MVSKIISAILFVSIATVGVGLMADDYPEHPVARQVSLGSPFWLSSVSYLWDYSGNEPTWNNRKYKTIKILGPWEGGPEYVIVKSATFWGADPKLYYKNGSSWAYLSDDHGGNLQFKTVIHFNGEMPDVAVELLFNHYSISDTANYTISTQVHDDDPQETGCYYLEVYSDGSMTKVWH
ncbi:MAG: hypothetical protein QNJ97_22915 [Myxococcota bacterium]|nr:hypothetical protein [Myxococcota bacterium]